MRSREYVVRQATVLLNYAQAISDRAVAAALVNKAADLVSRFEDGPKGCGNTSAAEGTNQHR